MLILEDFDPKVVNIASQPFELIADRDGRERKHVPDFMVAHADSSYDVIDVKPARRMADPEVAESLRWAGGIIESRGWGFRIASEPDPILLTNVRFLAGYRRSIQFPAGDVQIAEKAAHGSLTIGEAMRRSGRALADPAYARAIVLHLLWRQELRCDLTVALGNDTRLENP